jgi:hypothetical protein
MRLNEPILDNYTLEARIRSIYVFPEKQQVQNAMKVDRRELSTEGPVA